MGRYGDVRRFERPQERESEVAKLRVQSPGRSDEQHVRRFHIAMENRRLNLCANLKVELTELI